MRLAKVDIVDTSLLTLYTKPPMNSFEHGASEESIYFVNQ